LNCVENDVMNTLELTGLSKIYGEQAAVDDVSISVGAGESLAVIGHNGAGKTTLIKLILGLTQPNAGAINRWSYRSGSRRSQGSRDSVGFLPESVAFPGTLSGRQMLRFYARLKGCKRLQCEELLELVGLSGAADNKINTYSKGMRQRLGLAQALLGEPELLLLDEPTSGLDPFLRRHFYEIISSRQAAGTSVIISSHALTEIEARTDRIAIMKTGRLLEQGTLEQLRRKAALPVRILVHHGPGGGGKLLLDLPDDISVQQKSAQRLDIACREEQKLALVHKLTAHLDDVLDVVVRPPQLDDLYAHFVNGAQQ
jgi:Cu-processing system ATP-binding protein